MEDRVANVVMLGAVAVFVVGLFLVVTAFSREPPPSSDVPPAQVVVGTKTPIDADKGRLRISAGRLIAGLLLVLAVGAAVMLLVAGADLGRMASH